jgi:hypothetical protein
MEVTVMDEMVVIEVVVIVAMPISVPSIMPTIPGIVTGATMPCGTKTSACDMSSMPAATGKARSAHSANVSVAHATHVAHATNVAHATHVAHATTVSGARLPY